MTDIEVRFTGNGDDGSLIERQLLSRASVKMESRNCLTKKSCCGKSNGNVSFVGLHRIGI
jgi:hypothetical protein